MEYLSFRRTLAKEDNFLGFKCNDVIKNFFVLLKLQCLQVFWSIHGLFFLKFKTFTATVKRSYFAILTQPEYQTD